MIEEEKYGKTIWKNTTTKEVVIQSDSDAERYYVPDKLLFERLPLGKWIHFILHDNEIVSA